MVEAEKEEVGYSDSDSEEKVELTKEQLEDMILDAVKINNIQ